MNESSTQREFLIAPSGRVPAPSGVSWRSSIADAIRDGRLQPQSRLPSSRDLAAQLGVSRGVVTDAYAQLAAQGFLETRPRTHRSSSPARRRRPTLRARPRDAHRGTTSPRRVPT